MRRRSPAPNPTELNPVDPGLGRGRGRPAALAATCPARPPSTRSSCCRPPATRSASSARAWTWPRARSGCASPAGRRRRASCAAASSRRSRRSGFLDFLYFTDFEDEEAPQAYDSANNSHHRPDQLRRPLPRACKTRVCDEIPVRHRGTRSTARSTPTTNLLVCGAPILRAQLDRENSGVEPGWKKSSSGCSGSPSFLGTRARPASRSSSSRRPTASCSWPPRPTASSTRGTPTSA